MNELIIAPSILSADFAQLGEQVRQAIEAGARYIHVDVMDGRFVPNITIGPLVVKALRPLATELDAVLDVHLMIENPERYIVDFAQAGADIITVHVETCPHLHRTIQSIHEHGAKAGVTLNPATPLVTLEEILPDVELVLIMSVNPGFGGQKFIPSTLQKLREARTLIDQSGLDIRLEIDGGVGVANIREIAEAGADTFVAGSAIYGAADYAEVIGKMREQLQAVGSR